MDNLINLSIQIGIPEGVSIIPAQKMQGELYREVWEIALAWVIKLEFPNSKLTVANNRKLATILRPHGEFLHSLYLMCEKLFPYIVFDFPGTQKSPYKNHWELFLSICEEWVIQGFMGIVYPTEELKGRDKKEAGLRPLRAERKSLKEDLNPFKDTDMKRMNYLMDVAIYCRNGGSKLANFDKQYYLPFLKSWRHWILAMDKPEYSRHFLENGHLYKQGKGRYKIKII